MASDSLHAQFIKRISKVTSEDTAQFGQMNVHQMICHCTDQFRMLFGEIQVKSGTDLDAKALIEMAKRGETLPTVKGANQVAGEGTKPTVFENDKKLLMAYLNKFVCAGEGFTFAPHPNFGNMNKSQWETQVWFHLKHHLGQFGR